MLAFFAFIGFEDMVNVVEEVTNPSRTMPLAIILTLVISTGLYLIVAWVAIRTVPAADLAASSAPLALVAEQGSKFGAIGVTLIAIIAALNGVLVMIIMGARVLYGLAARGQLPAMIGTVHPRTRTPVVATVLITSIVAALSLTFPLELLAETASRMILSIFALINVSLIVIKLRNPKVRPAFQVPMVLQVIGALSAAGLLIASFTPLAA